MEDKYKCQSEGFERKPAAEKVRLLVLDVAQVLTETEKLAGAERSVLEEVELEIVDGDPDLNREVNCLKKALLFLKQRTTFGRSRQRKNLAAETRKAVGRKFSLIEGTAGRELYQARKKLKRCRRRAEKEVRVLKELEDNEGLDEEIGKRLQEAFHWEEEALKERVKELEEKLEELLKGFKSPAVARRKELDSFLAKTSGVYQPLLRLRKRAKTTVQRYERALADIESQGVVDEIIGRLETAREHLRELELLEAGLKARIDLIAADKAAVDGFLAGLNEVGRREWLEYPFSSVKRREALDNQPRSEEA